MDCSVIGLSDILHKKLKAGIISGFFYFGWYQLDAKSNACSISRW